MITALLVYAGLTLFLYILLEHLARIFTRDATIIKSSAHFGVTGILYFLFGVNLWPTLGAVSATYLATGGWKFARVVILTLPRDVRLIKNIIHAVLIVKIYQRRRYTVSQVFDRTAEKHASKPCVLFQDQVWTYEEIQWYSNKVANFLRNAGYEKGDVIAIFTDNCPQYFAMWIGMSRIGVIAALVNSNLKDVSLAHCINVSKAKAVIFAANRSKVMEGVTSSLSADLTYYCLGATEDEPDFPHISFDKEIDHSSPDTPPVIVQDLKDVLLYIYTSGTTGMPKAASISHLRCLLGTVITPLLLGISDKDIVYVPLPLYHSAGGIVGVGSVITAGATLAIPPKFSASQFWADCVKYKCTVVQYIGEICRYVLAQPDRPEERRHSVRVFYGNGMKPLIWKSFQERFGIPNIFEFYAATEGNCQLVNLENKVGSIGFISRIIPSAVAPMTLVKVDPVTNEAIRDSDGICIKCDTGEPGELLGKIVKGDPSRDFEGYTDGSATNKKIMHNVVKQGDRYFATGDILVMDELGNCYFRDRIGDTFRWKGENVSTNEVEAVISNFIQLSDAVVYGVEVPGCEGRAGMAAIVDENGDVDVGQLGESLSRSLPAYACPLFIRFIKEPHITGTFKLKKTTLREEGFDTTTVKDRMYFLNPDSKQYEPLTGEIHAAITEGQIRY